MHSHHDPDSPHADPRFDLAGIVVLIVVAAFVCVPLAALLWKML